DATVVLETPPMGVIALVASERLRIAPFARWWTEVSGLPAPPFLLAPTGHAALPGLLALLAQALAGAQAREADAARALVAARQEMEETREAMADTARYLAHRPPSTPRLVLSGEAGELAPVTGAARHMLGTGLAGLAAIAVHIAGPATGEGLLHFRLLGAESDRAVGAWAVPASALATGWLTLDLPTPLGPMRETAMLEVIPEGDGLPALSREARWAGTEGDHPLAVRAWAGAPGSRYLAPAHWIPDEVGLRLPAAGIPLSLPAGTWEAARPLEGQVDPVALGDEAPRPLLRAPAGGRAVILVPHVHAPGLDRIRIAFASGVGQGASVAAWLHSTDTTPAEVAALDRLSDGGAATGWRDLPEGGVELTLPLSARLSGRASLAIGLRAGGEDAVVEVAGVTLSALRPGEALPAPIAAAPAPPRQASAPPARRAAAPATGPAVARPAEAAPPGEAAATTKRPPAPLAPAASPAIAPPTEPARPVPTIVAAPVARPPAPVPQIAQAALSFPAPLVPTPTPEAMPAAANLPPINPTAEPAAPPLPPPAQPVASPPPAAPVRALAPAVPGISAPAEAASVPAPPRPYVPPKLPLPPMPRPLGSPAVPAAAPIQPAAAEPTPRPAAPLPAAPRPAVPPLRATPTNVVPGRAPARFETVRLHQHLPGESYRHLDMTVASLASGPMRWAAARLKLASKDGEPRLEFRQAAGWPHMFRDWLGRASDKFGPFLRITQPELRGFLDSITDERDAAMMQALLGVLPRVTEDACRQAGLSVADTAQWLESARHIQEEGTRPAG
ncbi:MAG TPA: DUF6212 domain-containing protein, partial [Roseomonas sp.]